MSTRSTSIRSTSTAPNNRKPWYPQGSITRRVISSHNGLWLSQIRVAEKGELKKNEKGVWKWNVPWISLHCPTDFDTACLQTSYRYGNVLVTLESVVKE